MIPFLILSLIINITAVIATGYVAKISTGGARVVFLTLMCVNIIIALINLISLLNRVL